MHERGVAVDLVRTAGVVALDQGAARVRRLRVSMGSGSHIDPESLRAQIAWHARGTICEGAEVECEVVPVSAPGGHGDDRIRLVAIDVEG